MPPMHFNKGQEPTTGRQLICLGALIGGIAILFLLGTIL